MIARRLTETPRPLRADAATTVPDARRPGGGARRWPRLPPTASPPRRSSRERSRACPGRHRARCHDARPPRQPTPRTAADHPAVPRHAPAPRPLRAPSPLALGLGFLLGLGVLFGWLRSHGGVEPTGPARGQAARGAPVREPGRRDRRVLRRRHHRRGARQARDGARPRRSSPAAARASTSARTKRRSRSRGSWACEYLLIGKVRWEKARGRRRAGCG